jgi:hypothetical protein
MTVSIALQPGAAVASGSSADCQLMLVFLLNSKIPPNDAYSSSPQKWLLELGIKKTIRE